jgi:hypothetical protein
MTQKLCRRLQELEKISAAAAQRVNSHVSTDSVIEEIRDVLRANDFQQEPDESLAQTVARFMGISLPELRQEMMEIASGHSRSVQAGGF